MNHLDSSVIYKITSPSGNVYVGQTRSFRKRMNSYKNGYTKRQPILHRSIQKYGWNNHVVDILEECDVHDLNIREIFWGNKLDVLGSKGLNCKIGERSETFQRPEVGRKISASKKGVPCTWGDKIGEAHKGKKLTKEHHDKILKAATESKYKPVVCVNTGEKFKSIKEASEHFSIYRGCIENICNNRAKKTREGLVFKFITN